MANEKIWKPNVTVAAVIEKEGRFLLVEEETDDGLRFNQPAGHLECREALVDAVVREALEETGHHFCPDSLVGIYSWRNEARDVTYLRFAFAGAVTGFEPERQLDDGIVAARWLTLGEVQASADRHRSPLVLQCIEDWLSGRRYPLELLAHYG